MTEREYRALALDSYSSVKVFIDDRKKYYRQFVLGEKINEKSQESDDMRFGGIVDCILLSPNEFDEKYIITTATKPKGQMLEFVHQLHKKTLAHTDNDGALNRNLEDLMDECYVIVGFSRDSIDKVKERFTVNKEGYDYYMELRDKEHKLVLTPEEVEQAHRVAQYLETHHFTRKVFNMQDSGRFKVHNQLIVTGEYKGFKLKMMSDKVIEDMEEMTIHPFDLKVMGNIDIFPYNYLKLKYYLQLGIYTTLLKDHFQGYEVKPFKFITADKYNYMDPVIVRTKPIDYENAMNGFEYKGMKYKGVDEALDDIAWHRENGIWTCSREAAESGGLVDLKLFETDETD